MHRVLKISTENAFCLHSKERVPYHIIIEVAYEPVPERKSRFEEEKEGAIESGRTNPFKDHDVDNEGKTSWPVKKLRGLANAASKRRSGNKNRKSSLELEDIKSKGNMTSRGSRYRSKTNLLSRLPRKKFFGEGGASNKLIDQDHLKEELQDKSRPNYNQTVLISVEKSLGELNIEHCKPPADTHSDGALDTKDIHIDDQDEEE